MVCIHCALFNEDLQAFLTTLRVLVDAVATQSHRILGALVRAVASPQGISIALGQVMCLGCGY